MPVPKYDELFNPVMRAIKQLDGSATIPELNEQVIRTLSLPDEEVAEPHGDRGTKLEYRLAWARSYLKAYGLLENSSRGVWALTPNGNEIDTVDPEKVKRFVRNQWRLSKQAGTRAGGKAAESLTAPEVQAALEEKWREELLAVLRELHPGTFERLCQRLLRESGFVQVNVTGRSGDGGIDGVGIVRIGGLLGFPVLFQCKRYSGSVSASAIRDFRGAMIGRADRGLVITTGTFSRDAKQEATRDGAPPIDLVDGEELLDKLKELRLGVRVEMIEEVTVDQEWFEKI